MKEAVKFPGIRIESPLNTETDKTDAHVPEYLLNQLSEYINDNLGLYFPKDRWRALKRSMAAAARDLDETGKDPPNMETFINRLLSQPPTSEILDVLARRLTIGETYFFRDMHLFDVLRDTVLPEIIRKRRYEGKRLRFWSAGCCTGEEPYTLAILLDRMLADRYTWNIKIMGSDINTAFIERAREGVYTTWSFRETPKWALDAYFTKSAGGRYRIVPKIKRMVDFMQLNLAENGRLDPDGTFKDMDIVFCRNVMMYFKPEQRHRTIDCFASSLKKGGWFVISPSESGYVKHVRLNPVNFSGVLMFRKTMEGAKPFQVGGGVKLDRASRSERSSVESKSFRGRPDPVDIVEPPPDVYLEAITCFETGSFQAAVDSLRPLLESASLKNGASIHSAKIMYLAARALGATGETAEAVLWCEKAAAADHVNPEIHYFLATLYQEIGRFEDSKTTLRHVLFLDPEFAPAHFTIGNLMRQEGKTNESRRHFEKALDLLTAMPPDTVLPHGTGAPVKTFVGVTETLLENLKNRPVS